VLQENGDREALPMTLGRPESTLPQGSIVLIVNFHHLASFANMHNLSGIS